MTEREERAARIHAIIGAALAAAGPEAAVERHLAIEGDALRIADEAYRLGAYDRVSVVGAGKAGAPMAAAAEAILGERIAEGLVVVREGYGPREGGGDRAGRRVRIVEAGHPLPDARGVRAAGEILRMLSDLGERDLVLVLLSGGGSALLTSPVEGISLADLGELTEILLGCGAAIHEINAVRKHISRIKGGRLARAAHPATVVTLILSDVVGDRLDSIASGPTVPDPTTYADAWAVLERHGIAGRVPPSIAGHLRAGMAGRVPETPKPGDPAFARVRNAIVANNEVAAEAAAEEARRRGFQALLLTTRLEGEAREVGRVFAALARSMVEEGRPLAPPACLVAGGETTVTLRGSGKGGCNQELALAAAIALGGREGVAVAAMATDGTDGPTDAAGAVAWGDAVARARSLGIDAEDALARNDAYPFFQALGDLVVTGPTRTNVNDLVLAFAF